MLKLLAFFGVLLLALTGTALLFGTDVALVFFGAICIPLAVCFVIALIRVLFFS